MKKVTEAHNDVLVKYRSMKQDLDVSNHAKAKLELKVDALSVRALSETIITNDESKIHYYTGLPLCAVLRAIYLLLQPKVYQGMTPKHGHCSSSF